MLVGGESRVFAKKVRYNVVFADTEGLRVGSPVMITGVQVGAVSGIHLPTDPRAAGTEVELGVDREYAPRVRQNSTASLKYLQWLSGEKYVEIRPGDPAVAEVPDGTHLPVIEDTALLQKGVDIADNLNEITISLKTLLVPLVRGDGMLGRMIQDPDFGTQSMDHLRKSLENLEAITTALRRGQGLAGRLVTDPALAGTADEMAQSIHRLAEILDGLGRKEGALGKLLEPGGPAESAVADLRSAAAAMRKVAERLEAGEGILGKLLRDQSYADELARDLHETAHNLARITAKIDAGQGTLGALVNERTLHDGLEDVVAGTRDSKFSRWLLRHYQKEGMEERSENAEQP
jgi:phospholipid/cholesterol/gamma-HCH transport system substrate-binding protein